MATIPPSWTELLGRMAAVSFETARGRLSWRHVDEEGGSVEKGSCTFVFRRSGDLRIDGDVGLLMLRTGERTVTRDPAGRMQLHEGHISWGGPANPERMLGGPEIAQDLGNPNDFSRPSGRPGPSRSPDDSAGSSPCSRHLTSGSI